MNSRFGETAREMVKRFQVKAFAVSGFAGTINPEHELLVQRLLHEETGLFVTCGHELSDLLNFRTRAMTAVLNARIIPRSIDLLDNIEGVLHKHGIKAQIVVVKGDGTLMSAEMARGTPGRNNTFRACSECGRCALSDGL